MDESEYFSENGSIADGEESVAASNSSFKIAREDVKLMNVVRAIVILTLLTVAFISAETVFIVTTMSEENSYREGYTDAATQLVDGFYHKLDETLWVARTLATDISLMDSFSWPLVTVPSFTQRCEGPLHQTKASIITLNPLVSTLQLGQFEDYAAENYPNDVFVPANVQHGETAVRLPTGRSIEQGVYRFVNGQAVDTTGASVPSALGHFPLWQVAPSLVEDTSSSSLIGTLYDEASNTVRQQALQDMVERGASILTNFLAHDTNGTDFTDYITPRTVLYYPVVSPSDDMVLGAVGLEIPFEVLFQDVLEDSKYPETLQVVVENSCGRGEPYTFHVAGSTASFDGAGSLEDEVYKGTDLVTPSLDEYTSIFASHGRLPLDPKSSCVFNFTVYASAEFFESYITSRPDIFRAIVLGSFVFILFVFCAYDRFTGKSHDRVIGEAARSDAIVRSLFPSNVRDRLYEEAKAKEERKKQEMKDERGFFVETQKNRLKRFVDGGENVHHDKSEPIADLFPRTTILFADIAGFTAWSSEREPSQVFTLLETVYGYMDRATKKYGVFKVETVGDCYVAATGVPDEQANHVEKMVRYARTCCHRVNSLTRSLERQLGPGTADLRMRFGIHSGPVTAGVLRGQKARFQLFGDTMNMAARIESTGEAGRIHLSEACATLLKEAGFSHWVTPRLDKVHAKGKGELQTYWLRIENHSSSNASSECDFVDEDGVDHSSWKGVASGGVLGQTAIDAKMERLVRWNTETLIGMLKPIVAYREAKVGVDLPIEKKVQSATNPGLLVKDEIKMVIDIPEYNAAAAAKASAREVSISENVQKEMYEYVYAIASGYPRNEFHNFEHASHVILSATKLLKRIMSLDDHQDNGNTPTLEDLHRHTFGIGTDPLTQFAVVFGALIHDVGHPGVPNGRLAEEQPEIADKYKSSLAEQRSVDVAWSLLMMPRFANLVSCICDTPEEHNRFRHLIVNGVMATDIFDKTLMSIRTSRWQQAFYDTSIQGSDDMEDISRKATIVIEHIIQASDVSHTMQHWYIYQKWNERLFREMYTAYHNKRSDKDPSDGWYKGELWFFDNYVIPLAKKLKECQVFGISSDEYLNYAMQNRDEWAEKGQAVVDSMKRKIMMDLTKTVLSREILSMHSRHSQLSRQSRQMYESDDELDDVEEFQEDDGEPEVEAEAVEVAVDGSPVGSEQSVVGTRGRTSTLAKGQKVVMAPPGPLGILLDPTPDGPVVEEVRMGSSLISQVRPRDMLVSIDDVSVRYLSSEAIMAMIKETAGHTRKLVFQPY